MAQVKQRSMKRKILRGIGIFFKVLGTLILIGITTGALLACFGAVYIKTVIMPQTGLDFDSFFRNENSVIYATDPTTGLQVEQVTLLNTTSSIWKDYNEIPQNLINATIAIEDKRFLEHFGVDWRRTAAAVLYMFTGQDIQGGSTITQQTVKNLTQFDDITVKRKIIEIFCALDVDSRYSKEDIITRYLNIIYLGEGNEGVGSAAQEYFDKDVEELTLAQCAALISITNNPSIFSPYSTLITTDEVTGEKETGFDRNKERQELVLYLMLEQEFITQSEYYAAISEDLQFSRSSEDEDPVTVYTWYEEQVISDVRADLVAQYGYSEKAANILLATGGLSIYSLVDLEVQAVAESVYQNWDNLNYPSKTGQKLQSAITIINNSTGDIAAIVGQMGEKSQNLLQNFASSAERQPGSAMKPISTYAPALELGMILPNSMIDDYPTDLNGRAWPSNAHGYYSGMISVIEAVRISTNTIPVEIVGNMLTPEVSFRFVTERFHVSLKDNVVINGNTMSDMAVAPLALGGLTTGVTTREMAQAYATFPNGGIYSHGRTYSMVKDSAGNIILDNRQEQEVALKETTAYYMNTLLKGVVNAGTGTSARISGMTVAGKTGTTDSKFDLWFVGYTPYYTAAVWTGYEYNEEITAYGHSTAAQMWQKVMSPLHTELEYKDFNQPGGLTSYSYCLDSGLRPNEYCSLDVRGTRVATGQCFASDIPTETCTAHSEDSTIRVCLDAMGAGANSDGFTYCLAGEHCPEESVQTMTLILLNRVQVGNATASDDAYVYRDEDYTACTIHDENWVDEDDSIIPVDPDTGLPLFPIDPETGLPIIPVDPDTGVPLWPSTDTEDSGGIPGVTTPVIPGLPSTDDTVIPDTTPVIPDDPVIPSDTEIPAIPDTTTPETSTTPEATIPGVG